MTKYQKYFTDMLDKHTQIFKQFKEVHDKYAQDSEKYKTEFNQIGSQVMDIIREYENRLCGHSERGMYGKFSSNLAEKFWAEIRKHYPKIDFVWVK